MELPPLSSDVENLIDLTIELVNLIYWEPDAEQLECHGRAAVSIQQDSRALADVDMPTELGWITRRELGNSNSSFRNSYNSFRRSRTGGSEIQDPGKNATHDERREYWQYLMSGRGASIHLLCSWRLLFD
jgi:hypothetical protein